MNNTIFWMLMLSILSIIFGIILWRKGTPYGTLMSTLHKIISFALGLVYILVVYVYFKTWGIILLPLIIATITLISFIVSVVSGSIMLGSSSENRILMITHQITSIIAYALGIYSLVLIDLL